MRNVMNSILSNSNAAFVFTVLLLSGLIISFAYGHPVNENKSRDQLWKEVDQARSQRLPKTEMELLQRIYTLAVAEQEYPDAARALLQKIVVESTINQPAAPFAIKKLQSEIENVPESLKPITDAVLANWMYAYFQSNRWRFQQRSQTSTAPSDDIETWDLRQILQSIDESFTSALSNAEELKKTPVAQFSRLTEGGNAQGDLRRPTAFDFIAHEALEFYALDEQITQGIDAFEITADSPIFSVAQQFLNWQPASADADSFALRTIKLYQQLLTFHQNDDDPTAYLAADLERLSFAGITAKGQEKTARYQSALQRFADKNKQHPISTEALAGLARSQRDEGDLVEAHRIATIGLNRFKDSPGGAECQNLILSIQQPAASIATELNWNSEQPEFTINYKNINQISFRIVEFKRAFWELGFQINRDGDQRKSRQRLLNLPVIKQWDVELAATEDYQMATQSVAAPDDLKKGAYLIIGLIDAGAENDNEVVFAENFWRTDLAHVARVIYQDNVLQGQVLDSVTGLPVAAANIKVQAYVKDQGQRRARRLVNFANTVTDSDGIYSVKAKDRSRNHHITITHGDDTLYVVDHNYRRYQSSNRQKIRRSAFFTDRSIYRPGQTINFKVVCTISDAKRNDYLVSPNENLEVQLLDMNNEVVETIKLVTNDLGSAAGTFTAPKNRATGRMRLQVNRSRHVGQTSIRVEQYKRPKFKVDIEKPDSSFALGDSATVTGHAMAYNGASVDGAQVNYRVVRNVRYAGWWYWRCWWAPVNLPQVEIAQGTTETKTDGTFEVNFDALADPAADRAGQPTFAFTVYADVTDSSGETRSAQTRVNVGFVSLAAEVSHEKWLTTESPANFKITTETLDGVGQAATGKLIVRKLTPPEDVQRKPLLSNRYRNGTQSKNDTPDLSDFQRWPVGDVVHQQEVTTDEQGAAEQAFEMAAGAFRVTFETNDPGGEKVLAESSFLVIDPSSNTFPTKIPDYFAAEKSSWQPGETWTAVWGTGYDTGAAYVEIFHRQQPVSAFWTNAGEDEGATQKKIEIPIQEKHRGGLHVVVTYLRENRLYSHTKKINVPWENKKLAVKWEHFVSKLQPGGKETWTAVVSGPDAESSAIEMVAAMYDSSLDQFMSHKWPSTLGAFYNDGLSQSYQFNNRRLMLKMLGSFALRPQRSKRAEYRYFANDIGAFSGGLYGGGRSGQGSDRSFITGRGPVSRTRMERRFTADGSESIVSVPYTEIETSAAPMMNKTMALSDEAFEGKSSSLIGVDVVPIAGPNLTQVSIRKNLQETAFFYPNLIADEKGRIKIQFEVPEALTTWKFMGLTHDGELRTGLLTDEMTTSKDLMIQPNPPRFLREGDQLYFSIKVTNQSDQAQTGIVQLQLNNAFDESSVDAAFGNSELKQSFDVPAQQSRSYHWKLDVPDFVGAITYKAVGASDSVSDGEEGFLPVLSKRILVTESLPLPIRGNQTRTFTFGELEKMDRSDSLKNQSLTVQMTSNPSWYAVMALPYLMEYPHQCSEQTFNRMYANALGQRIVNSNPRIKTIFQQWRGTDALKSPLEKNDDLRNVTIAESPWLIDGKNESQSRRNVGLLFDNNRMNNEVKKAVDRLAQMQLSDGSWPWFSGGPTNEYLTLYITTGFGRLMKLGVDINVQSAIRALSHLDGDLKRRYDRLVQKNRLDRNNLNPTTALYLYGRTFFLEDQAIADQNRAAFDYFVQQAKTYWPKLSSRQSQAHVAIALKRLGDVATAGAVMKSLTERSLRDDELGQYWNEADNFWFWANAPIETQALLIEAYDEVLGDAQSVQECKIWLLKQKQTQAWKSTKSTADAVYALLLRGTDQLSSSKLVDVTIGGKKIQPAKVEAGTGFFQEKFTGDDISSGQKTIEIAKSDDGIAWGSVHWQYLEDVSKIEPYKETPLTVQKSLFIKRNTDDGPEITPVDGAVEIGDELVTRVEIRVDRDMEFVHLKDYRGSGTEPVNVLSQYRRRDGLSYYESTQDTASHFFIENLRKGTYVFETSVRVQHAGKYQTGIAQLQCMYAPEFNSHSGSVEIEVNPAE